MNEITRIHLARVAYDIELGAKKELDAYIKAVKTALNNDETLMEVEQRMSEILLEQNVKPGGVITSTDVKAIREQLGEPREFGDAQAEESTSSPMPRRLLRDMERKQLSGVAAGVGAYFGTDVVIVRLVFILLALVNGLGILLYLVLWAIMPPARTLHDRLSLRGETATLEDYKDYDAAPTNAPDVPGWLVALGRWVLGLGILFVGWLPVVFGSVGTVATLSNHNNLNVLGWVMIVAAWIGALAFSVFMTTTSLAILRWNFTRIKWPLVISGVIVLLAGVVIASGGPVISSYYQDRDQQCQTTDYPNFKTQYCGDALYDGGSL